MKLAWRQSAREDLRRAVLYIADRDPSAAERLQEAVESCAERLSEHPFMYRAGRLPGTREAIVHPNYVLVYQVRADAVEVLGVVHSRQQYP